MLLEQAREEMLRPLGGKYRRAYSALLGRLHGGLFSVDVTDQPTKPELLRDLGEALEEHKASLPLDEAEHFRLTANDAYSELVVSGWLTEQREGWAVYVELEPRASRLLEALCGPDDRRQTFGGTMVSVLSSLEAAMATPQTSAQGIGEAARRAKEFARYVRTVVGTLKGIEKAMLQEASLNGLVRAFFEDFVERIVIRDYRTLTLAKNHPYSFKWRILDLCEEISSDQDILGKMQACIVEQGACVDLSSASASLSRDMRDIASSLESIESFRHRIDLTKTNIERRFSNTLRYMDAIGNGGADRYTSALAALSAKYPASLWRGDDEINLVTWLMPPVQHFDGWRAMQPTHPRRAVEIQRFHQARPDPLQVAFERAKADFDKKLTITPQRFMDYVKKKVAGQTSVRAVDIPPSDIEELVIFSALRSTPTDRVELPDGFIMRHLAGMVDNDFIACGDFIIEDVRASGAKRVKHAV